MKNTGSTAGKTGGNNTVRGILYALLAPSLWGVMALPIRTLGEYGIKGQDLSFFRCLIAGGGLFLYHLALRHKEVLKLDLRGLLLCVFYGCSSYGLAFVSYAIAIARIPVAVAMVLMFLGPVWVSLMNRIVFKEHLTKQNAVSIVICLAGAVMASKVLEVQGQRLDPIGIICAVLNGFGASVQLIIPRYFEKEYKKDSFLIYGYLGVALIMAFFTQFGTVAHAAAVNPGRVLSSLFFLAGICTLLANLLFVKAGSYIDSTLVSILAALEVVVGSLVGFLVYKEELTLVQSVGCIVIVIGVLLPNLTVLFKRRLAARHASVK